MQIYFVRVGCVKFLARDFIVKPKNKVSIDISPLRGGEMSEKLSSSAPQISDFHGLGNTWRKLTTEATKEGSYRREAVRLLGSLGRKLTADATKEQFLSNRDC